MSSPNDADRDEAGIDQIIAEAVSAHERIIGYECRDCGKRFQSGRDGRKHMFSKHEDPSGLRKIKAGQTGDGSNA